MSKKLYEETSIQAIADAIREKNSSSDTYKVSEMASAIQNIEVGIDTSDATATASDIKSGKTAYVNGGKITGALASVAQATPSITVSSNGLITTSATQSAGIVEAGTKSSTKQLAVQAAQTITPSTSNKTIASGKYLTGTQTIKGDSNLVAENIKKDVSIFGVTGTLESGGGGSQSETWVLENVVDSNGFEEVTINVPFTANGTKFNVLSIIVDSDGLSYLKFDNTIVASGSISSVLKFNNPLYRKVTFSEQIVEDSDNAEISKMYAFLAEPTESGDINAVKQPSDQAIQTDMSLTITSNGTTTITPDAPYDAMSKVDLAVNVAGSEYKIINTDTISSLNKVKEYTLTHNLGRKPKFIFFCKGSFELNGTYSIQWFCTVEHTDNILIMYVTSDGFGTRWPIPAVKEIPSDGFAGKQYYIQVGNANESTISFKFGETSSYYANLSSGTFIVG